MLLTDKQRRRFWANKTKQVIENLYDRKPIFNKQINEIYKKRKQIADKTADAIVKSEQKSES